MKIRRTLISEYEGKFGEFFQKRAQEQAELFGECVVIDGVPRWCSNNSIPPDDLLELWYYLGKPVDIVKSIELSRKEASEALNSYCRSMENYEYTCEALQEMEATFGKGAMIVDVITGNSVQL